MFQYLCSRIDANFSSSSGSGEARPNILDVGSLAKDDPHFKMLSTIDISERFVNGSGCFGRGAGRLGVPAENSTLKVDLGELTSLADADEKIFRSVFIEFWGCF